MKFINHNNKGNNENIHRHTVLHQYKNEAMLIPSFPEALESQSSNQVLSCSAFPSLPDFSMKYSVIILPQFSMQPIIIAALTHLFCQSEMNEAGQLTPNISPNPPQTAHTHAGKHSNKHTQPGKHKAPVYKDTHAEKPIRRARDGQETWALG